MNTVLVSIGNSDDKLTQLEWSRFCGDLHNLVLLSAKQIYGVWYSEPSSRYQNMAITAEVPKDFDLRLFRERLANLARRWRQESIALLAGDAELVLGERE